MPPFAMPPEVKMVAEGLKRIAEELPLLRQAIEEHTHTIRIAFNAQFQLPPSRLTKDALNGP